MTERPTGAIDVLARQITPAGTAQLLQYHFFKPAEGTLRGDGNFRVELSLTARHQTARACFVDEWKAHRFERVGELYVVHPNANLIAKSDEDSDVTAIVCEFAAQHIIDLFDTIPESNDTLLMASLDVRNDRVKTLLLRMAEEIRHPGFASATLVEANLSELHVELYRHGKSIGALDRAGGLASWRLRLIEDRLRELGPAPAIFELAELCGLSVRQLTRGFRVSRDCSLGSYTSQSQIGHAKRLLSEDHSVGATAAALGFSSSSSFCFAFRRETGMTPKQYRERLL